MEDVPVAKGVVDDGSRDGVAGSNPDTWAQTENQPVGDVIVEITNQSDNRQDKAPGVRMYKRLGPGRLKWNIGSIKGVFQAPQKLPLIA